MATTGNAPLQNERQIIAPAIATAGNDGTTVVCVAPFDGTLAAASYVPNATQAGAANPNNRTLSVVNKGQAGAGATSMASQVMDGTHGLTAFDEYALALSGTAANLAFAAGDVLAFSSTHNGTGVADPGGVVRLTLARNQ